MFVLAACLRQRNVRGIQIPTGDGSLVEEVLARVVDLLLRVEGSFGSRGIKLSLLNLLREAGARRGRIARFGLLKFALALLCGAGKVSVFEERQELTLLHVAAALHIELADGRADFGRDHGLLQRRNHGFGRNSQDDGAAYCRRNLHGDDGFGLFLGSATSGKKRSGSNQQGTGEPALPARRQKSWASVDHGTVSTPVRVWRFARATR